MGTCIERLEMNILNMLVLVVLFGRFRGTIWLIRWMRCTECWVAFELTVDAQNDWIRTQIYVESANRDKSHI